MPNKLLMLILALGLGLTAAASSVQAALPYYTHFFETDTRDWERMQAVYVPDRTMKQDFGEPVDLFVDRRDYVYVADRKHNHIVVLNPLGQMQYAIGDADGIGALNGPEGVFVDEAGIVYVADSGNERIALFSREGSFLKEFRKPDSPYLSDAMFFVPTKLVVDRRGVIYVTLSGSEQGMMRISPEGDYAGVFGANKADHAGPNWLKRLILNKEQLSKEVANRPRPLNNIAIDRDGFLYTASAGPGNGNIRKLNAGGLDLYQHKWLPRAAGVIDVAVDADGFVYGLDADSGSITLYDPFATGLISFGGIDINTTEQGVLGFPTSIAINSAGELWVADSRLNLIQTFKRNSFGNELINAIKLSLEGDDGAAGEHWRRILESNGMYGRAFQGIGKVEMAEGNYKHALDNYKAAKDLIGYSEALWELRYRFLQEHLVIMAIGLIALGLGLKYGKRLVARIAPAKQWPLWLQRYRGEIKEAGFILLHPYQGFYKLKERKTSWGALLTLVVAAFAMKLLHVYGTGFLFNPVDASQINLASKLFYFVVPWLTWIIANYLVCSVRGGEGRFREVIEAGVYALVPYLWFSVPIVALSNIIVLEERVLLDASLQIMYIWVAVLLFVGTQVIHGFEFTETILNIAIVIFTISIIWFFVFVVSGLTVNLFDFLEELLKEVRVIA